MARFVVSDPVVSASFGTQHVVILSDFKYWNDHWDELLAWCQEHGCRLEGATVDIPADETMTLFALRWS